MPVSLRLTRLAGLPVVDNAVFSSRQLLDTGRSSHKWDRTSVTQGLEDSYLWLVSNAEQPAQAKVSHVLDTLSRWKALRWKGGGRTTIEAPFTAWVGRNCRLIDSLQRKRLAELSPQDLQTILYLAGSAFEQGWPPTMIGKSLHFLLPHCVVLWDLEYVRDAYGLGCDVYSFVGYQNFGRRILRYLADKEGRTVLSSLSREHVEDAGFPCPLPKLIDEIAYSPDSAANRRLRANILQSIGAAGPPFAVAEYLFDACQ